jgi:hypothetical protein
MLSARRRSTRSKERRKALGKKSPSSSTLADGPGDTRSRGERSCRPVSASSAEVLEGRLADFVDKVCLARLAGDRFEGERGEEGRLDVSRLELKEAAILKWW